MSSWVLYLWFSVMFELTHNWHTFILVNLWIWANNDLVGLLEARWMIFGYIQTDLKLYLHVFFILGKFSVARKIIKSRNYQADSPLVGVMTCFFNVMTSFWRHDTLVLCHGVLLDNLTNCFDILFDVMMNFLKSCIFDMMEVLCDVMAYLLTWQRTSCRSFWYYNILVDVMMYFFLI